MVGIASAATAVVIGIIAGNTSPFALALAASCCPTIRRSSLLSSSEPWRALPRPHRPRPRAARPEPTARHCWHCAAMPLPPRHFRRTYSSCRRCSGHCSRGRRSRPCPAPIPMFPCGFSDRACSARSSPPCWVCPMPLRRISRPMRWIRRLHIYRRRFEPSLQRKIPRHGGGQRGAGRYRCRGRAGCSHRSRCDLPTCSVAHAGCLKPTDRRHRDLLVAVGKDPGLPHVGLFFRWLASDGQGRAEVLYRADGGRRTDGGLGNL